MKSVRNKKFYAMTAAVITVLFSLACPSISAAAVTDSPASLSLLYTDGETGLSGGEFSVWRVADISDYFEYTTVGDFTDYTIDENMTSDKWVELTAVLSDYTKNDNIAPLETGLTDSDGNLTFHSVDKIGLYLVKGKELSAGENDYIPSSFLVTLPTRNSDNQLSYNVVSEVKFTKLYNGGDDRPGSDQEHTEYTEPYPNPTDSSSGDSSSQSSTNPTNAGGTSNQTTTSAQSGGSSSSGTSSGSTSSGSTAKLPQTGTLAWLVPPLASFGFGFVAIGIAVKLRKKDD